MVILIVAGHAVQLLQQSIATVQKIAQSMAYVTADILTNSKLCVDSNCIDHAVQLLQQHVATLQ